MASRFKGFIHQGITDEEQGSEILKMPLQQKLLPHPRANTAWILVPWCAVLHYRSSSKSLSHFPAWLRTWAIRDVNSELLDILCAALQK